MSNAHILYVRSDVLHEGIALNLGKPVNMVKTPKMLSHGSDLLNTCHFFQVCLCTTKAHTLSGSARRLVRTTKSLTSLELYPSGA